MTAALLAQARQVRVLTFFGCLAWVFGVDPPPSQRLLVIVLAVAAMAANALLDEHKIRPAKIPRPPYDTAA